MHGAVEAEQSSHACAAIALVKCRVWSLLAALFAYRTIWLRAVGQLSLEAIGALLDYRLSSVDYRLSIVDYRDSTLGGSSKLYLLYLCLSCLSLLRGSIDAEASASLQPGTLGAVCEQGERLG